MHSVEIDLAGCDREPIHIPGAIQPHGALLALCDSTFDITHASDNLAAFLGGDGREVIGRHVSDLIQPADFSRVLEGIAALEDDPSPAYIYTIRPKGREANYDAIVHRNSRCVILEFEPTRTAEVAPSASLYRTTRGTVNRLRKSATLAEMFEVCAARVREVAGFDRVMIYRFDDDWNGVVIAEARRSDLEPFLGLHYPASDIPSQARELYARNWLRFIADRDYTPVPVHPDSGPEAASPLDLSHSVLRSVSPVHLQYLRNMGVGASMSISLMNGDRLWGLIACHHYSPRFVPYDVRTACELFGQVMSMQLVAREERELSRYGGHMAAMRATFAERLGRMEDVGLALAGVEPSILDFMEASGAAIVTGDEVTRIGLTPGEADILEIRDRLCGSDSGDIFATDALKTTTGLDSMGAVAAGLLAVTLGPGGQDWLMWFRPEQVREVNWAGDPAKSVEKGEEGVRLSPRGSFSLWKQVVRGRSRPWSRAEIAAATDMRRDLAEIRSRRAVDLASQNRALRLADAEKEAILASERAARGEAERLGRMKDEFVATLSHELRTPLNAIIGWTSLLRNGRDEETVREASEVIERNARVQATMIEDLLDVSRIASGKMRLDVQPVDLTATVSAALDVVAPAAQAKGVRLERLLDPMIDVNISGDPTRLQQVVWNLLSNAVKFTPKGGKVQVVLERVDSHVEISVADTGRGIAPEFIPHIFDRFRQEDASTNRHHGGLGLGLSIVRHLVELHGGTVFARSGGEGTGSTFVVSLPVRVASSRRRGESHPTRQAGPIEDDTLDLDSARVLVVDDEADSREMMRRILEESGAAVTTAGSAGEALDLYRDGEFEIIVSDIGMPGTDGYELIKNLRNFEGESGRVRTPAIALTAYARPEDRRRVLLSGYQFHVAKPVEPAEITAVIANLLNKV